MISLLIIQGIEKLDARINDPHFLARNTLHVAQVPSVPRGCQGHVTILLKYVIINTVCRNNWIIHGVEEDGRSLDCGNAIEARGLVVVVLSIHEAEEFTGYLLIYYVHRRLGLPPLFKQLRHCLVELLQAGRVQGLGVLEHKHFDVVAEATVVEASHRLKQRPAGNLHADGCLDYAGSVDA